MKKTALLLLAGFALASVINYGINAHVPDSKTLQLIKAAGIQLIRIDINWYEVEPKRGVYDWSRIDAVVAQARKLGLEILGLLAYTPSWANGGKGINYPPDNVEDWKRFVKAAVSRYRGKIKYWNLWNEPNVEEFWALDASAYVEKILNPGAEVLKFTWPDAVIVGPEVTYLKGFPSTWNMWLREILKKGGKYWFDVISIHIYKSEGPEEIFKALLEGYPEELMPSVMDVLEEEGVKDRPFWITETGWSTTSVSEEKQAEFYKGFLQRMKQHRLPAVVVFYEIKDNPSPQAPKYGILRADYSKKPAYNAYAEFIANNPVIEPPDEDDGDGEDGEDGRRSCAVSHVFPPSFRSDFFLAKGLLVGRAPQLVDLYYRFSGLMEPALEDPEVRLLARQGLLQALQLLLSDRPVERQDFALLGELCSKLRTKGFLHQAKVLERVLSLQPRLEGRRPSEILSTSSLINKIKNSLKPEQLP